MAPRKAKPGPAKRPDVVWIPRGWQPVSIGFAPSKWAWDRETKRLTGKVAPYPQAAGCCTTFEHPEYGTLILVTLNEKMDRSRSRVEIAGLLCHEATHAWQRVREVMNEDDPSIEFEAYSMQAIFQSLYQAWLDTRCPDELKAASARIEKR